MWKFCIDIARHAQQWMSSIAITAADGNESLAASYVIGISAVLVAIIAVLVIVLLKYANRRADGSMPRDVRARRA